MKSSKTLSILIIALFLFIFFIQFYYVNYNWHNSAELESSWIWALNKISFSKELSFGDDVFFTYGPLYFLTNPFPFGLNKILAAIVKNFYALSMLLAIIMSFKLNIVNKNVKIIAFVCMFLLMILQMQYLWIFSFLYLLFFGWVLEEEHKKIINISYFIAGTQAAICSYVGFNSFCLSLAIIISFGFLLFIYKRKCFKDFVCYFLLTFFAASFIIIAIFFNSIVDYFNYLLVSYEIAKEYSVSMSLRQFPSIYAGFGILISLLFFGIILKLKKENRELFLISTILLPVLFMSFKHGFVRQDWHMYLFFSFVPYLAFLLMWFDKKGNKNLLIYCMAISILSISCANVAWRGNGCIACNVFKSLKNYNFKIRTPDNIKLPEDINNMIGENSIEILPISLRYAQENNWNWRPNPILQLYSVYSKKLDEISENHFYNEKTPEFLMVEFYSIDRRNMYLDTPLTWNCIVENYKVVKKYQDKIFLKKNKIVKQPKFKELAKKTYSFEEKIFIPKNKDNIYAKIQISQNLKGKLADLFFRNSALYVNIGYKNGYIKQHRLVFDTLKSPTLVSKIPIKFEEFNLLLEAQSEKLNDVSYIEFKKYRNYYNKDINIIWMIKEKE